VAESFSVTKDNMALLKEELEKTMRQVPNFENLKSHIEMTLTSEGLRIELLSAFASVTGGNSGRSCSRRRARCESAARVRPRRSFFANN
jgi:hypothetical protein